MPQQCTIITLGKITVSEHCNQGPGIPVAEHLPLDHQGCKRDVEVRDRDETETFGFQFETRPRSRPYHFSRDRDRDVQFWV